jgi:hypothetical protein
MKRLIFSFFALPFIALCICVTLHAQSSETELDQVELTKQFIGKWIAETGEDSTQIWEAIPYGNGYEVNVTWQAKGETYSTAKGLLGFASQNKLVNWYHLWPELGIVTEEVGKFVTDKNLVMERFNVDHTWSGARYEINFITPDKWNFTFERRGKKESWDDAVVTESVWTRVKK